MTRILVTGSTGQLGRDVVLAATAAGHRATGLSTSSDPPVDLTDAAAVRSAVAAADPEVIIHAAAWTAVDACELDPDRAMAVNGTGTRHVVDAADAIGAHVVYVSTDYVFDGTKPEPYVEADEPNPLSSYGRSKLAGEAAVGPRHTIARTSWVCSTHGPSMVQTILRLAATHHELRFVDDQVGHPTFTADLAPVLVRLGTARQAGTFHTTNAGAVSWFEFARAVLAAAGLDPARVQPTTTTELVPARPAPRPANSVLDNAALRTLGWEPLPHFDGALHAAVAAAEVRP